MSQSTAINSLDVYCNLRGTRHFVGRLAERNRSILFEYDKDFLNSGIELSPFKLPLQTGLFEDKERVFDSLPGVLNDSLPDGWGLLLLDRALRAQGVRLHEISPLQRLSMVGSGGMGRSGASGSRSNSEAMTSTPAPPSMKAWWSLATSG